jgi:hypothetical protein
VLNGKADNMFYGEELVKAFGRQEVPIRCSPMPTFGYAHEASHRSVASLCCTAAAAANMRCCLLVVTCCCIERIILLALDCKLAVGFCHYWHGITRQSISVHSCPKSVR